MTNRSSARRLNAGRPRRLLRRTAWVALATMLATMGGCASAWGNPATSQSAGDGPATRAALSHPDAAPMQPIADPTEGQLRDYWERTIVKPLKSGRLRGRVVTATGRPMPGVRVAAYLTEWGGRGRNPAMPESWLVTDVDGSFDLHASVPNEHQQFMLHVQQLPYILRTITVGIINHQESEKARNDQERREGRLICDLQFDSVVANALLARGELMPSTAIEGGVDVVVRHLADEEEHAAIADQPPETLAQVTRDGKFTSSIDEKMRFQGIHDGQVLIRYTIHKVVAEDREQPTLIRVPVDGYYGLSGTKPEALEVAPEQLAALSTGGGEFHRADDLIGYVRDKYGQILPASRRMYPFALEPQGGHRAFAMPGDEFHSVWVLVRRRPDLR